MGLGYIARGAAGCNDFVGDGEALKFRALARLVLVRVALGLHPDDQSVAGLVAAFPAGVGRLPRASRNKLSRDETRAGRCGHCVLVLRALDRAQLHRIAPADSATLQSPARTVHREQRKLCRACHVASENHKGTRAIPLFPLGRNGVHGRRKTQGPGIHARVSGDRTEIDRGTLRGLLGRADEPVASVHFFRCHAPGPRATRMQHGPGSSWTAGNRRAALEAQPVRLSVSGLSGSVSWLYYVTHSNLRYRHPIDPVMLLLVAIAMEGIFKRLFKQPAVAEETQPSAAASVETHQG